MASQDSILSKDKIGEYPSPFLSPGEKEKDSYGLAYAKAMYNEHSLEVGNVSTWLGGNPVLRQNYLYAEGRQDAGKYKTFFSTANSTEGNTSHLNLNYRIVSFLPSLVKKAVERMLEADGDIVAEAIDPTSTRKKIQEKYLEKANILMRQNQQLMQDLANAGVQVQPQRFEDDEEIELFFDTDYKSSAAIAAEKWIKAHFEHAKIFREKDRCAKDWLCTGFMGIKKVVRGGRIVGIRRVDPLYRISDRDSRRDFTDSRHAGEIVWKTISEIKVECNGKIPDDTLLKIAKQYGSKYGNPYFDPRLTRNGVPVWRSFRVPVLEFAFRVEDKIQYVVTDDGFDSKVKMKTEKYVERRRGKEQLEYDCFLNVYEGIWILDTDHIYNYRRTDPPARAKEGMAYDVKLPFCFYETEEMPMVELLIPAADTYMELWLRQQQEILNSAPSGHAINVTKLGLVPMKNTQNGEVQYMKPMDVIKFYHHTGDLLYGEDERMQQYGSHPPITPMDSNLGDKILALQSARLEIARSAIIDAGISDNDIPVRQTVEATKIAGASSDRAIRDGVKAMGYVMIDISYELVLFMQRLAREGILDQYTDVIGSIAVEAAKAVADLPMCEMGLYLRWRPTEAERQQFLALVMEQKNYRVQTGRGGIELDAALKLMQMTNLKDAERYLSFYVNRQKKRDAAAEQQAAEMKAQLDQQSAQAAAMARQQETEMKLQAKQRELEMIDASTQNNMILAHVLKMKEIEKQNEFTARHSEMMASQNENRDYNKATYEKDIALSVEDMKKQMLAESEKSNGKPDNK